MGGNYEKEIDQESNKVKCKLRQKIKGAQRWTKNN